MTMHPSLPLGRIAGIKVAAHWSLVVVVWLIAWSLADTVLPASAPGASDLVYWCVGFGAALTFFACLLAHELAHSIVARRRGVAVQGIVLWLFGGVSQLDDDGTATADAELGIAVAGPATSAAIAVGLLAVTRALDAWGGAPVVAASAGWLGWMNAVLAAFNMVPAFPLDGGRVLQAWLWRRSGDKPASTLIAARAGRIFAFVLIGLGIVQFAVGAGLSGLWLLFLGWFLLSTSTAEASGSIAESELTGLRVRSAMSPDPVVVPEGLTVGNLVRDWMHRSRFTTFPIVDIAGRVVGMVTMRRVKRVRSDRWDDTSLASVACPPDEIVRCGPNDPLLRVIHRMNRSTDQRALVFDDGRLVGILSPSDVSRAVERANLTRAAVHR